MQVQEDVRKNRERAITRVGAIVRNAENRLPELRVLRILVFFRLFDRALFQGTTGVLDLFDQAPIVAFFARRELFCLFWISIHRPQSVAYTLIKAPSSSN